MNTLAEPVGQSRPGASNTLLLLISWIWVGVPLAWGVSQTVKTSLALFK